MATAVVRHRADDGVCEQSRTLCIRRCADTCSAMPRGLIDELHDG
ncbi:MAG TPA: hypothetical protein VGV36_09080 [Solirubrobacteraceae bacterium]|nr:hypothetical protein [Solirubrobacteraceae bacterium]